MYYGDMPKQEQFAVRTVWYDGTRLVSRTTIADNRPQAIIHAERIGKIDDSDREVVRNFLEDGPMRLGQLCVCSGGTAGWDGVATIFLID